MEEKQGIEEKIHRIAHYYGADSQLDQTIEELAELTVAIRKFKRDRGNKITDKVSLLYNLSGEIADVEIMLEQLKYLLPFVEVDVEKIKVEKLDRQIKRIVASK